MVVHVDVGSVVVTPASDFDGEEEPEPEHIPMTDGRQVKSPPQSEATLQGSCHLNTQVDVVVWVQTDGPGVGGGSASHGELVGHPPETAVPPLHDEIVSAWQTMP